MKSIAERISRAAQRAIDTDEWELSSIALGRSEAINSIKITIKIANKLNVHKNFVLTQIVRFSTVDTPQKKDIKQLLRSIRWMTFSFCGMLTIGGHLLPPAYS